jgi:hypothetical protein
MKLGPVAVGTVLVTIASSGCGGSSTLSSRTTPKATTASSGTGSAAVTPPPGTPAALRGVRGVHGGVLVAGDLPGFVPQGYRAPSTSAQSAVAEYPPERRASEAARLKALGFIASISEQLAPAQGRGATGEAISLVEQFRSAHGASGEVAAELKQALARGESAFAVPGIPGARGFGSSTASPPGCERRVSGRRLLLPRRLRLQRAYTLTADNGRSEALPSRPRLRRLGWPDHASLIADGSRRALLPDLHNCKVTRPVGYWDRERAFTDQGSVRRVNSKMD